MSTIDDVTPKQRMISVLQQQPEDSTYEELLKELAFVKMVERGLKDVDSGRVTSNEDVKRRIVKLDGVNCRLHFSG
jgi:predicted transcriptional regulator